jgi:uncharacterized protein (TIGR02231 family)
MNRWRLVGSLVGAWVAVTAQAAAPEGEAARTVDSAVTAVTVYPDSARVTRTAKVTLDSGIGRLAFAKLPGWIDEGSVRATVTPPGAAELLDVQILRAYLARPDDEEVRKAEAAVEELADQVRALDDEKQVLDARAKQVESIRLFSLEKLPKDAAAREVKLEEYGGVVAFVADSMSKIAQARRDLDRKRRALAPEQAVRERRLDELRQRAQLEQRTVVLTLKASKAGPATLGLSYLLPGATWEPMHELRAEGGGASNVTVASYAVVTQTTGEDWPDVTITLSTQASTDMGRIPELEAMPVSGACAVARAVKSKASSFASAFSSFEGQVTLWNRYVNAADRQQEFDDNRRAQVDVRERVSEIFRVLQLKRGTTAHFAALAPQTIRTDGRPVRLPIGVERLAAQMRIVAAPAASLNAARVAELKNTGAQPLLPGRGLLYREGAFLGATELDFVAQGETFAAYMGVADHIKLSRALDRQHSSLSLTGRRTRAQAAYKVVVENLSEKEADVELGDRVPISETDEIRVSGVRLVPSAKPDNKGLVKWDVRLAPKQTQEFRVEYTIEYPTQWPQTSAPEAKASVIGGVLPSPADASVEPLRQQIQAFEAAL